MTSETEVEERVKDRLFRFRKGRGGGWICSLHCCDNSGLQCRVLCLLFYAAYITKQFDERKVQNWNQVD